MKWGNGKRKRCLQCGYILHAKSVNKHGYKHRNYQTEICKPMASDHN